MRRVRAPIGCLSALQWKSPLCIPRKGIARPQFFHLNVSVSDLYIPRIGPHIFSCSRIGRPIVGIFESLTNTWMRILGPETAQFLFREICVKFSVLCLFSVNGKFWASIWLCDRPLCEWHPNKLWWSNMYIEFNSHFIDTAQPPSFLWRISRWPAANQG